MRRLLALCGLVAALSSGPVLAGSLNPGQVGITAFSTFQDLLNRPYISKTSISGISSFRGAFFNPASAALTVGGAVAMWYIQDHAGNLLQIVSGNQVDAPVPPGWVDPYTPPNLVDGTFGFYYNRPNPPVFFPDNASAAAYACSYTGGSLVFYSSTRAFCDYNGDGSFDGSEDLQQATVPQCVNGYSFNGSQCQLVDPSVVNWPSDGIPTLIQNASGTGFQNHPKDTDLGTGGFPRTGVDPYGNPTVENISPNPINGIDWQKLTQSINPLTGAPNVQSIGVSTGPSGNVISSTYNVTNNSTINDITNNTTTNIDTSTLAQDATLQQTNAKLDKLDADLIKKDTTPYPALPQVRDFGASMDVVINKFKDKIKIPELTGAAAATCPTFDRYIPFIQTTLTISAWCDLDGYIRPTLNAAFSVIWLLMGFYILLRA